MDTNSALSDEDMIDGGDGNDRFLDDGEESIIGGMGNDVRYDGTGDNTLVFRAGDSNDGDHIAEFEDGKSRIQFADVVRGSFGLWIKDGGHRAESYGTECDNTLVAGVKSPTLDASVFISEKAMARNRIVYCMAAAAVVICSAANNGGTGKGAAEEPGMSGSRSG